MKFTVSLLLVVLMSVFYANRLYAAQGITITEKEYGDKWPVSVSEGRLTCRNSMVIFTAEGINYGVNGLAQSHGYARIDPIWKDDHKMYSEFREIDKYRNMSDEELAKKFGSFKINIGGFIQRGLNLCR